jgi:hypothetical protein
MKRTAMASPVGDMFPITHSDRFGILNKFFEQPDIGSEYVSNMKKLGKWPAFIAESIEHTNSMKIRDGCANRRAR